MLDIAIRPMQYQTLPPRPMIDLSRSELEDPREEYTLLRDEATSIMREALGCSPEVIEFSFGCIDELHAHHPPSAAHCLRVALLYHAYTTLQPQEQPDEEQRRTLFVAALLHDFSKSMIPVEEVLEFPGDPRMDPEKWGYILAHPELSARLLLKRLREARQAGVELLESDLRIFRKAAQIIRYHHMFADANNCYPPELAAQAREIPEYFSEEDLDHFMASLCIAIADHFDAGLSRADAQNELHTGVSSRTNRNFFPYILNFFKSPELLMQVLEACPEYTRSRFGRDPHEHREEMDKLLARARVHIMQIAIQYYAAARTRYANLFEIDGSTTQLSAAG